MYIDNNADLTLFQTQFIVFMLISRVLENKNTYYSSSFFEGVTLHPIQRDAEISQKSAQIYGVGGNHLPFSSLKKWHEWANIDIPSKRGLILAGTVLACI
jgi:hypothetical protein